MVAGARNAECYTVAETSYGHIYPGSSKRAFAKAMADIAIKSEADIPKIREKIGAMSTGQPFKASILRAWNVIELTGKAL
jgi:hypothetical protein